MLHAFDSVRFCATGTAVAVLTVVILIVKFCVEEFAIKKIEWTSNRTAGYVELFVKYFIIGVTVLVVAVPEGLPLAVTLALAYSVKVSYPPFFFSLFFTPFVISLFFKYKEI